MIFFFFFFPGSNCFTFCFRLSHFNLCLEASFCSPPPCTENFCTFARADFLGNSVGKKIPYLSCQSCWRVRNADFLVLLQAIAGYAGWWVERVKDEGELFCFFPIVCPSCCVWLPSSVLPSVEYLWTVTVSP